MKSKTKTAQPKSSGKKFDAFQAITQKIVDLIETGKLKKWAMPWDQVQGHDRNLDNRPYSGANPFLLGFARMARGFTSSQWGSFKMIKAKKGKVRKGEKPEMVCFWSFIERSWEPKRYDDGGNEVLRKIGFLKAYPVWNLDQTEGLEHLRPKPVGKREHDPIHEADKLVAMWSDKPVIKHEGDRAFYRPATDAVTVPIMNQFHTAEDYYGTLFHELIHASGHKSRLDRLDEGGFGSDPYAKEELVAELGSAFLSQAVGISEERLDEKSAAYMMHWAKQLKQDKRLFVHAASAASKAANLVSEEYLTITNNK